MASGYIGTGAADRDPAIGNDTVTSSKISDDAVTAAKINILDDALAATDAHIMVADGTDFGNVAISGDVTMTNAGVVTIANTSVENAMMAANSVDSDQYVDGSIDNAHLAANSVDSDQYVNGSIDNAHLAANSVDSDQYVDGSIDTDHIAANAVDGTKIAMGSDAAGDVLTYTGTDYVRLAKGTAGQALIMNGGATAVEWGSAGASLSSAQEWTAQQNFNNTALTFDATQDWALTANQVATLTLTANTTFDAPTQMVDGAFYSLIIIQDGTGSRTASWNTVFKWAGGTAPTLTTTASAKDIFVWRSDGTNMYEVGRQLNVS